MIDTLRADQLSCYGGPVETPHLCSLAADHGSAFYAFGHASWTKPAAASLLTSLLPSSHGATTKTAAIPQSAVLVSEAMQQAGYVTGGIVSNINLAPSFGFDQGWDEYTYLAPDYLAGADESSSKTILYQIGRKVWFTLVRTKRVGDYYQNAETVNAHVIPWIERHAKSRFFLFAHYMDPHDPYFRHPYDGYAIARVSGDPPASRAAEMRTLYQGEIRYLDEQLGALFERLRALGLYDDLLIALTADHGEELHEHGGFWHGLTLYDEQIHIPLLVKWPRGAAGAPARVFDRIARQIDIVPTLLARAGVPAPPSMQGVDLLADDAARHDRDLVHLAEEDHEGNVLRAICTLQWKSIEAKAGNPRGLPERELFEVAVDPGETQNVESAQPEIAARLRAQAATEERIARERGLGAAKAASLTDAQRAALKALGYLQ
jgi:arylsulfatase A-like enzyme